MEDQDLVSVDADLDADAAERERDLATLARVEFELAEVEHAMRRIEDGSYGTCEACRNPIEDDILSDHPTARLCRSDQQVADG